MSRGGRDVADVERGEEQTPWQDPQGWGTQMGRGIPIIFGFENWLHEFLLSEGLNTWNFKNQQALLWEKH